MAPESSPVLADRAPETRTQEPRVIEARTPEKRAPEARPAEARPEPRANMTPSTREEIWTIVRAAVEEAVAPVSAKLRDTEARLDRAEREIATRPAVQAPPTPRAGGAPAAREVPVLPPDAFPHDELGAKRAAPSAEAPEPAKKPSYIPTSYGIVTAHPPGPRPTAELDLSNVGPLDLPDFGSRRRLVGRIVVGVMLLCVAGAIVATVLSHA